MAPTSPAPEGNLPPLLRVRHLTVRQGPRTLLEDVSFDAARGSVLAIVGPNGAGKTTLLRALLGRLPYEGEVRWTGPVRLGYVPQKLVDTDIPLTVAEFLAMKCPGDYAACLATVGLPRHLLRASLGQLSAGEVQRVLIAWAIVDRPEVLLFDEPTSNVDIGSQEVIFHTLRRVRDGLHATVLLVTHDIHEVHHFADQVLVLRRTVLFHGPPATLLGDPRLLAAAFELAPGEHDHALGRGNGDGRGDDRDRTPVRARGSVRPPGAPPSPPEEVPHAA